jgi:hypothetical protein
MNRSFHLSLRTLSVDIAIQLREQGLTLGSQSDSNRVQRWANEINGLAILGLLTESERDRARKRLLKKIRLMVRPLPTTTTTTTTPTI